MVVGYGTLDLCLLSNPQSVHNCFSTDTKRAPKPCSAMA